MTFDSTQTFKRKFRKKKERRRELYARACVPGDIMCISLGWWPVVHSSDKCFVMHSEFVEQLLDSEQSHDCERTAFSI